MDEKSERVAKRFEWPLVVAAVLTIPVTILQLLPAGDPWRTIADVLNWAIWLAFLAELVVMLAVVPSKARWLRDHLLEVAIVVLTPPFLVNAVQSIRVLRFLRLARFCGSLLLSERSLVPEDFATPQCSRDSQP